MYVSGKMFLVLQKQMEQTDDAIGAPITIYVGLGPPHASTGCKSEHRLIAVEPDNYRILPGSKTRHAVYAAG